MPVFLLDDLFTTFSPDPKKRSTRAKSSIHLIFFKGCSLRLIRTFLNQHQIGDLFSAFFFIRKKIYETFDDLVIRNLQLQGAHDF